MVMPRNPLNPESLAMISPDKKPAKRAELTDKGYASGELEKFEPEEFKELRKSQAAKLKEFFGRDINVPPIPDGITPDKLEEWEKIGFELRYLPKIKMEESANYPGWKHKPGRRHTPNSQYGIEFFDEIEKITSLKGLSPNQLPGAWLLCDIRPKPNRKTFGAQSYEDDALIQGVLRKLATQGVLNKVAGEGLRNYIDPGIFKNFEFWTAIKTALGVDKIPDAIARLPRVIEANVMSQGTGFHNTTSAEWCEEYSKKNAVVGFRMLSGRSDYGGASFVSSDYFPRGSIGFRPLVVFPHHPAES